MSQSLVTILERVAYSNDYRGKYKSRLENSIDTGLRGNNGEPIIFEETDDIKSLLKYIKTNLKDKPRLVRKESELKECFNSAAIEGSNTTYERVNKMIKTGIGRKDEYMVVNILETIPEIRKLQTTNLTPIKLRNLWDKIVEYVCENERIAGYIYRSGNVYIGSNQGVSHMPCTYDEVERRMRPVYKFNTNSCNTSKEISPIIIAIIRHFYFEYVHPFCDGNGRMGRLWLYTELDECTKGKMKYYPISEEIYKNVQSYYLRLKESETPVLGVLDITTFIEFILEAIVNTIYKYYLRTGCEATILCVIDNVYNKGTTTKEICESLDTVYSSSTIKHSLLRLYEHGIVTRVKRGNSYVYYRLRG